MVAVQKAAPEKSGAEAAKPGLPAARPAAAHPFTALRDEMDRLFDSFLGGWPSLTSRMQELDPFRRSGEPVWGMGALAPKVDVSESESAFHIEAELPGMSDKDVAVTVSDGVLTLKGEKKAEREDKKKDYYLSERSYGSVQRTFELPDDVEVDKISAKFEKGVLTIDLPKSKEAKSKERKIAIAAR